MPKVTCVSKHNKHHLTPRSAYHPSLERANRTDPAIILSAYSKPDNVLPARLSVRHNDSPCKEPNRNRLPHSTPTVQRESYSGEVLPAPLRSPWWAHPTLLSVSAPAQARSTVASVPEVRASFLMKVRKFLSPKPQANLNSIKLGQMPIPEPVTMECVWTILWK